MFSTNFSWRILAHLLESVCLPLAIVAEETFAQVDMVDRKLLRFSVVFVIAIR